MERDELKRLCGINNSARIYSQLQRDYAKVCSCHPPPLPNIPHIYAKYKLYIPHITEGPQSRTLVHAPHLLHTGRHVAVSFCEFCRKYGS